MSNMALTDFGKEGSLVLDHLGAESRALKLPSVPGPLIAPGTESHWARQSGNGEGVRASGLGRPSGTWCRATGNKLVGSEAIRQKCSADGVLDWEGGVVCAIMVSLTQHSKRVRRLG